jgi:hypothetical protein
VSGDVTDLAGREFIAQSGNRGIVQILGERGLHITWRRRPSDADMRELEAWAQKQLGAKTKIERFEAGDADDALPRAQKAYARWLDENADPA